MRFFSLAFVAGVVTGQYDTTTNRIILTSTVFVILAITSLSYLSSTIKEFLANSSATKYMGQIILIYCLGCIWSNINTHWQLRHSLPNNIENQIITVKGIVASIPELKGPGLRFDFTIEQCQQKNNPWQRLQLKAKLNWYQAHFSLPPRVGERWQLEVKLKKPHGFHNPGSFNYEASLLAHHICATGYVRNVKTNQKIDNFWFHHPIDRIRQILDDNLTSALQNRPFAGQIKALTLGMGDAISQPQWQIFKATGTVHLMVIAGLHIGLVSGFVYFIVNFVWRRFVYLTLRVPAIQAASVAALIMAWVYSALAGFSIPTQRAVIMVSVFMGMQLLRRQLLSWNAFCLALLIVVVLEPFSTLTAGFWLSFAAVAFIIYGVTGRLSLGSHWYKLARIQIILGIGLIPLTLLWFQQASLSGIVANAIAIPWVGFIVAPLSLLGAFFSLLFKPVGTVLLIAAEKCTGWFWPILAAIAHFKLASWQQAIPNQWSLLAALGAVILLLAPKGMPGRWLGGIWLLPLFFYVPAGPKTGEMWLTLLDVGQGLATVIRTQHHVLVYDTGPKFSSDFDTGEAVVIPYLRTFAIKHLDALVISHPDNDHIGGAHSLLQAFPAKEIFTSVPERFAAERAKYCLRGQSWQWDGVEFKFIYPTLDNLHLDNNSSCVLRITAGKQHILLTGDIEKLAEKILLNSGEQLTATVLVAPHHGSSTSSTLDFIKAIQPQYVLFPVGYLNKFHFPKADVIARYQSIGAIMYDTATDGSITVKLADNQLTVIKTFCNRVYSRPL